MPTAGDGAKSSHYARPLSQVEIEQTILDDLNALEEATDVFRDICEEVAVKKVRYKSERAKAYLRASGSIEARKMQADHITEDVALDYEMADGRQRAQYQVLQTLHSRVEAFRSLNSNLRSQVVGGGG